MSSLKLKGAYIKDIENIFQLNWKQFECYLLFLGLGSFDSLMFWLFSVVTGLFSTVNPPQQSQFYSG